MKKVLKAFDNKDLSSLTKMMAYQCFDPNKLIPEKGVTYFHLIIGHQSENFAFKVTKLFLRYGADPNVASEDGVTPIHVAAAWGRTRILHLLLVNGGDPWLQDDDRKNAFNYAFEEQEWDAVEMLHHFQQMHSSASSKRDFEHTPKFDLNFERILLRKGQEMYEYALSNDKNMKSAKTQTQVEIQSEFRENFKGNSTSPILSKIKYFESQPSGMEVGWKKPEKNDLGWTKECYQSTCELIVNSDDAIVGDEKNGDQVEEVQIEVEDESEKEKLKATRYVSTIHIDTSPPKASEASQESVVLLEKSSNHSSFNKSSGDVRSQLFMELQEAVLRRSKQRSGEHRRVEKDPGEEKDKESSSASVVVLDSTSQPSIICIPNEAEERNSVMDDPFVAKEVSYLYGINLSNSSLLRHMSDFATKVMKEIELSELDNEVEKVSSSNPAVTSTYLTCEEESDCKDDDSKVVKSIGNPGGDSRNISMLDNSNDSFVSVAEEYRYTDNEEGVVLLEKKLLVTPRVSSEAFEPEETEAEGDQSSQVSDVSSVPSAISYASDTLRTELTSFGYSPGPITKMTKKLYLRKLWRLKKANKKLSGVKKAYSSEVEKTLKRAHNLEKVLNYAALEEEMMRNFDGNSNRRWREGASKTSFNYLLLDPRISQNLPRRAVTMPDSEIWECFLSSVFYVGKGKRTRPYAHLYEAVNSWQKNLDRSDNNGKIRCILDIWRENLGVVCLHVFQNIIPVEALTREAAMIDALGLANLKNQKSGEYYGSAATWTTRDKLKLGVYLLYKAMLIFLNEGERQIRPFDIT